MAAAYENENAEQAPTATARKALESVAEYLTDELRQGELVWQYRTAEDVRLRG